MNRSHLIEGQENKAVYDEPAMEIVPFVAESFIAASGNTPTVEEDDEEYPWDPNSLLNALLD